MIIGLTGGIASGKTLVSDYLKGLGYPVVDADLLSREVMAQPETLAAVRAAFGDGVFCADGSLDRAALARRVFSDPQARQRLDTITNPAIEKLAQARFAEYGGAPLVFFVVPLLYESGMDALRPRLARSRRRSAAGKAPHGAGRDRRRLRPPEDRRADERGRTPRPRAARAHKRRRQRPFV